MAQPRPEELIAYEGKTVYDQAGEKIGKFESIYADRETGDPEWIAVGAGGVLGSKQVLVPLEGFSPREDGISVAFTKDVVKNAPKVDDEEIGEDFEAEIYEYYGLRRAGLRQPTQTYDPSKAREASGTPSESMTRSEEQMRVGKREVEAGTVRLRKWGKPSRCRNRSTFARRRPTSSGSL
ncbi:MAG: PRC-barrel domain-containing protein [Dehalococcoidia bacterium]